MDALTLLLNRRSVSKLAAPAPQGEVLTNILLSGMRAPDHGGLRPWRFIIIENDGLNRFSQLLQDAAAMDGADLAVIDKAKKAPFRAPMIITVVAHCQSHEKIPLWEQVITAGCAVQAMQMAAVAQGFSGIWRSGSWTEHSLIRQAFSCREQDKIVGFLYLGTPQVEPTAVKVPDPEKFVSYF